MLSWLPVIDIIFINTEISCVVFYILQKSTFASLSRKIERHGARGLRVIKAYHSRFTYKSKRFYQGEEECVFNKKKKLYCWGWGRAVAEGNTIKPGLSIELFAWCAVLVNHFNILPHGREYWYSKCNNVLKQIQCHSFLSIFFI